MQNIPSCLLFLSHVHKSLLPTYTLPPFSFQIHYVVLPSAGRSSKRSLPFKCSISHLPMCVLPTPPPHPSRLHHLPAELEAQIIKPFSQFFHLSMFFLHMSKYCPHYFIKITTFIFEVRLHPWKWQNMFLQYTGLYIHVWSHVIFRMRRWQSYCQSLFFLLYKRFSFECVLTHNFETASSEDLTAALLKISLVQCCTMSNGKYYEVLWKAVEFTNPKTNNSSYQIYI